MRLVDCFYEIFYYTIFLESLDFSQLTYKNVIKHYKDLFSRSLQAAKKAGFPQKKWGIGLFAVCAWIDEYILCSDWPEKTKWQQNTLQLFFFKTSNAGEEFFTRLEGLDRNDTNVREVYDYCLALGFKGRYYDSGYARNLKEIKQSNLKLITKNYNLAFPEYLFPEAYSSSFRTTKRYLGPRGISLITLLICLLPVILFGVLFYIYENKLTDTVLHYLKTVF